MRRKVEMNKIKVSRIHDRVSLAIGAALVLTPWALHYADIKAASLNAWICGAVTMIWAGCAWIALEKQQEWHLVALGA